MPRIVRNLIIAGLILFLCSCCFGGGVVTGMWMMYQKFAAAEPVPLLPPIPRPGEAPPPPPVVETTPPNPPPPPVPGQRTRLQRLSPSWMGLSEEPSAAHRQNYEILYLTSHLATLGASQTQLPIHGREEQRFYVARDRVLSRSGPYGLWAWPQVRRALVDIGTSSLPLLESIPTSEPQNCIAFYETGAEKLAFCAAGVSRLSDEALEASLVHEATHVALARLIQERSGYSAKEFAFFMNNCADVAEEFLFTTEGVAFLNQAAYLSGRSTGTLSDDVRYDLMLGTAWSALTQRRDDEWRFAQNLIWYTNRPSENPYIGNNGRRCGQLVTVRGRYPGNYLLAMDFVPRMRALAEFVPRFRQQLHTR